MALSGSNMSSTLQGLFVLRGYIGPDMPNFADAVGVGGIDNHAVGKPFTTTDTGTITGSGAGTGTGVTGLVPATIALDIIANATASFGQAGPDLPDIAADLATAFVAEMALATLTSTHSPVWAGSGTVDPGSILFVGAAMGATINLEGVTSGFLGLDWADFADVIGNAFADAVLATGTGAVTIAGAGSSDGPGAGVGAGVLS